MLHSRNAKLLLLFASTAQALLPWADNFSLNSHLPTTSQRDLGKIKTLFTNVIPAGFNLDFIPHTYNNNDEQQQQEPAARVDTEMSAQVQECQTTPKNLHITTNQPHNTNTSRMISVDNDPWNQDNFQECVSLWDLDHEEQNKMHTLQLRLSDIKHWKNDPFEVVRFLSEAHGDVDEAESMFRKMIEWRRENNVDNILRDYKPPKLFDYVPIATLRGVDRDGDPIHIERTGAGDMLSLLERYGEDEIIKHAIWVREQDSRGEWHKDYQRTQGRRVKKFTVIMDLEGFNRRHLSTSLVPAGKKVSRLIQDYYPAFAKRYIVIRAPPIFRLAWSMFKPFIDPNTRDLIVFSSKNYEETLKEYVGDLQVLPPVITSSGQGSAAQGFNPVWEGGELPPEVIEEPHKKKNAEVQKRHRWVEEPCYVHTCNQVPMGMVIPS